MPQIRVVTKIDAPVERCFDLARDVEVHCRTAAFTRERVVGGVLTGLLGPGDTVTFEGVHFGVRQRLTARIVEFDPPHRFTDEMVSGAFHAMRHEHEFSAEVDGTVMIDTITWTSPGGLLGKVADRWIGPHLSAFLETRNRELKRLAETDLR